MPNSPALPFGYPVAKRSKLRLNVGWRLHLGDAPQGAQADFDNTAWELVNAFTVDADPAREVFLEFEGAHQVTDAWREGLSRQRVFSNCDEVELLVNGLSLGRREPDTDPPKANLDHPPFTFPICWCARRGRRQGLDERRGGRHVRRPHAGRTSGHRADHRRRGA